MSKVLIVAEHLDGKLNASTAKCVSAAKALNADAIDIVVLAADPAGVAADAAKIAGVAKVLAQPEIKQKLGVLGFEAIGSTAAEFAKFIDEESAKYGQIIRDAKIKAE